MVMAARRPSRAGAARHDKSHASAGPLWPGGPAGGADGFLWDKRHGTSAPFDVVKPPGGDEARKDRDESPHHLRAGSNAEEKLLN
jgi:hypothetical protein